VAEGLISPLRWHLETLVPSHAIELKAIVYLTLVLVVMTASGTKRHFAALQNLVAIGT
jgi:hypothetical protein